jgi:hypothetical protein
MARPNKIGIDYFPFDVDFFNDEKVEFVSARFGVKGEIIVIRLLCKIYRIGYYTEWNEDESTLLAKRAGDAISPALVSDVVKELVKRGFFDETLLNRFDILTSKGIQRRYVAATSERKEIEINRDFWLIDQPKNAVISVIPPKNGVNPPNNPVNRSESTQSKVKESKLKKNKKKDPPFIPPLLSDVEEYFDGKGYAKSVADKFHAYYEETAWKDKDGNPVKNWKLKAINVWFRPEHEKPKSQFTGVPL